jgi:uncharacterized membrane protein (UPF0182 family)
MRIPADLPRRAPRTSRRLRLGVLVAIVAAIILLSSARGLARFYTSYLWFQEVHFTSVFRGVLVTKVLLAVGFCVLFFVLMLASLVVADRVAPRMLPSGGHDELVERYRDIVAPHGRWVRLAAAAVFALFAGIGTNSQWNNWDLFRYHVSFKATDAQFHKDIGFYVFQLPFIKFLLSWSFGAFVVILLVTAVAQYLNGGIRFQGQGPRVTAAVKTHISVLLGVLAVIQAVNYYYQRFELVLSTQHVVDGATNTDIHANLPADDLLIAIAVIAAVLFLLNTRARGWTLPVVAVVVWAVVWVLVGNVYPALYQALRVSPSELSRESVYIQRNIDATRTAYGLNGVKVVSGFDSTASQTLPGDAVAGSSAQATTDRQTLANVQLLDPAQLVNTFDKLQSLRSFYSINTLNVDRYKLDINGTDTLTETLTGVRELNTSVPSGFTNTNLQYTHGYGAAVAPASEAGVAANGYPNFSLQNVPPAGTPALSEQGAQVYYGEGSEAGGFVIADSKQPELDYENSAGNEVSTHYQGSGGVPVGNIFRRLAFSLSFSNLDILLSGQVTDSSRIIYNRNIITRVQKAAPFLHYDADPYAVILDDQIYWIVDAYTTTANYPYSQDANTNRVAANSGLSGTFNYVRNSVKVVINAYTGKMDFFVVDPSDPIIQVYEKAFPDLLIPGSKADSLIPGITDHFRYPEDLFKVQTNMYGRYHLTTPTAFYTQANAWNISQDPGSGRPGTSTTQESLSATGAISFSVKELDPEYEVAALPGSRTQDFLILQPFVPVSAASTRQNLTAVMFASSDPDDYGQLTVYQTPPGQQINGPQLVTAQINANPAISSELSLLNQQGSEVELGEVVIVPIDNTLMYVQPVYVQSSTNPVPQLKDVIVVYDNTAYHSSNASLDNALCQITNPTGQQPFAQYCNTAASNRPTITLPAAGQTGGSSTSTTTVPKSPGTTTPSSSTITAPGNQSVTQLLADAEAAFKSANAALAAGNLGQYQTDNRQAEADVAAAQVKASSSSSTAKTSSTTASPSG